VPTVDIAFLKIAAAIVDSRLRTQAVHPIAETVVKGLLDPGALALIGLGFVHLCLILHLMTCRKVI
jgi:hypothetical protein